MSAILSTNVRSWGTKRLEAGRFLNACLTGIVRYFDRRAAVASLRELDQDALRDIGLERSQIEAAVHGLRTAPSRVGL